MRFLALLPTLAPTLLAVALPAPDAPAALLARFAASDECMQAPGDACSGAPRKDVVVQYGRAASAEERTMVLNAAKAAGATVTQEIASFGFAAFIPTDVVRLIAAHGEASGTRVFENGCAGIPWCGEAPC